MAGERRREAAGSRPVLEMEVGCGLFYANVKIDNSLLATGTIAGAGVALSVFFYRNPALVEIAVKSAFAGLVDRVQSITLSSVLVYLCFHTKERLLAFMDAFATGTVKQRLEEEFSIIGFKDELEVTVTVYDNASRIRKEMRDGTAFETFESFVGSMESDTEERPTQISKGLEVFKATTVFPKSSTVTKKEAVFGKAGKSSGIGSGSEEMTVGVMKSGGTLERGKRRLLIAAPSKEMTATSPKSRRVTKKEGVFGKAGEPSGIRSGSEEMTVGIMESGGALERGKRRLLIAAPSKEMTATSPKSRRVTKKEGVFGKALKSLGLYQAWKK